VQQATEPSAIVFRPISQLVSQRGRATTQIHAGGDTSEEPDGRFRSGKLGFTARFARDRGERRDKKGRIFATDENQMDTDNSKQDSLHSIRVHRSSSVATMYFSASSAISSEAGGKSSMPGICAACANSDGLRRPWDTELSALIRVIARNWQSNFACAAAAGTKRIGAPRVVLKASPT